MRAFPHLRCVTAALACVAVAANAAPAQVVLRRAALARGGIAIAALHRVRMARSLPVLGVVLDPAPLIRLSGDIATARAAVAAAKARVQLAQKLSARSRELYRGRLNSALDFERMQGALGAARIALAAAEASRQSLLAQTAASWGPVVTTLLREGVLVPPLAAGKAILVGLSLPPGKTIAVPPVDAEAEAAGTRFSLHFIGPVPKILGAFPGQNLLYRAAAQPGVPIGATVAASLATGPQQIGVMVPWSAVLWRNGRAIVFRAAAGNRFEPVPIATDFPTGGGYFVSKRLSRGDRIVLRGAALLLGAGRQQSPPGGEDSDD